ncbi:hypothetical protein [Salinisphaera sp. T31B1]|uniref:hypothetical protein n=1 Tax=Salinisphaera sp. T31B1 TaxID=727963 RepID=UPI0033428AE5
MAADPRLGKALGSTRPDPALPDLAVGAVAMGEKYADWCLTMLTSLRERGAYRGPIYVITDRPELFSVLDNVRVITVPPTRHRLIAKACKQVLMSHVEEPLFVYLDSDLVITSPFVDWVRMMQPGLEVSPMLCYPDVKPCEGAFHGGVVVLDTRRGMPIVRRWEKAVATGRWGSDQACLYSVADSDGPTHMPDKGMSFITQAMEAEQPDCIVHITNGGIRNQPRAALLRFLKEQLGVSRLPREFG